MRGTPSLRVLYCLAWLAVVFPLSAQGPLAYKARGNRLEGLADRPNARNDYELLGFFAYDEPGDLSPAGRLSLTYYVPSGATVEGIKVAEIVRETQYEMTPQQPPGISGQWNTFSDWPEGEVLAPANVDLSNLGVVVSLLNTSLPDLYAPVLLYRGRPPANVSSYELWFASRRQLRSISCTLMEGAHSTPCSSTASATPSVRSINKGPVCFTIDASRIQGPTPATVAVHIHGDYANTMSGEALDAEFHFTHLSTVRASLP